jgi:hypothetical protein
MQGVEAEALLRRLVAWSEEQNLFREGVPFLTLGVAARGEIQPTRPYQTLTDWNEFWGLKDTGSHSGVSYADGDIRAKPPQGAGLESIRLDAAEFRLKAGGPGQGAGKAGEDLGPALDLVGPGAAYERWKETPEYQQWLEDTGQVKPEESGVRDQESQDSDRSTDT